MSDIAIPADSVQLVPKKQILRLAYDTAIENANPTYWEMSRATSMLFKLDGQDFCGLPVNINNDLELGEWLLYEDSIEAVS